MIYVLLISHLLNILHIAWYLLRVAFFTQQYSKIYPCLRIVHFTVYSIPLYTYTEFMHSPVGHLGYFLNFASMNNALMHIHVHVY